MLGPRIETELAEAIMSFTGAPVCGNSEWLLVSKHSFARVFKRSVSLSNGTQMAFYVKTTGGRLEGIRSTWNADSMKCRLSAEFDLMVQASLSLKEIADVCVPQPVARASDGTWMMTLEFVGRVLAGEVLREVSARSALKRLRRARPSEWFGRHVERAGRFLGHLHSLNARGRTDGRTQWLSEGYGYMHRDHVEVVLESFARFGAEAERVRDRLLAEERSMLARIDQETLVQNDFILPNMLVNQEILCVLDFMFTTWTSHYMDLGKFVGRLKLLLCAPWIDPDCFQRLRGRFLQAYSEAIDFRVDDQVLAYFEDWFYFGFLKPEDAVSLSAMRCWLTRWKLGQMYRCR